MACHSRGESGGAVPYDVAQSAKLHSSDSVAEWRSREQLEPSPPSTSPAYWDSDEEDDLNPSSIVGPKPSDLYGKFTWKIENFSEISKRELRSNVFEVGGYKWYILVYPQGCDVCNHLSLFLCVADYDKLLPGWSHFAQFTIAVVNKDPKKSKYSDTLHRFCKKEHDWGWKKFMELSKVLDGFTVADTLVIKAQVQVIRENPHRPFRCLDCQYRRELVRVYLTNVEGICRRFVEEKREKLGKLIEDTPRWTSFRAFWSAVEEGSRRRLAREKTDVILKAVVKRFFNEKEVTSTLVMDALYSGCKALDYRSRNKKGKINGVEMEETINPIVWVEKDAFVLAGDVLTLLERAVSESLPPYKDDKGPQNRTKDVGSGDDFGKDSIERDERRLTELGRRTVEMFVLAHLYTNRVEVAYREAVALKRQEELIREEEAAGQAETEMRAKREAAEKEKRSKKKQAKQRRKDRKEKDKEAEEKKIRLEQEQRQRRDATKRTSKERLQERTLSPVASTEAGDDEDNLACLETVDEVVGTLGPATEDGDTDHAGWEREGSYGPNSMEAGFSGAVLEDSARNRRSRKQQTSLDDSSSTCSSDSLPSVRAGPTDSFVSRPDLPEKSVIPRRGGNRIDSESYDNDRQYIEADGMLRSTGLDSNGPGEPSSSSSSVGVDSETVILSLKDRVRWLEQRLFEKEEEVVLLQEQLSLFQHQMGLDRPAAVVVDGTDHSRGVRPVEETRGETSISFLQSGAGNCLDVNKGVRMQTLGRVSCHFGSASGAAACSGSFHSTVRSENVNTSSVSATAKAEPFRSSGTPCRSKNVDSSRPPRILTPPITGFSLSVARPGGVIEETSLPHSLPATSAAIGASISRPSSAPGLGSVTRPIIPLAALSTHSAQPLARSMSAGPGRLPAGAEPVANTMSNGGAIQGSPVTPSYKNATIGKTRSIPLAGGFQGPTPSNVNVSSTTGAHSAVGSSASATTTLTSVPPQVVAHTVAMSTSSTSSTSPPLTPSPKLRAVSGQHAAPVANGFKRESGVPPSGPPPSSSETGPANPILRENSLGGGSSSGPTSMGITFGTVTPELLPDDQSDRASSPEHSQQEEREHFHRYKQEQQQLESQASLSGHASTMVQQRLHQHPSQTSCADLNGRASLASLRQTSAVDSTSESIHSGSVLSEEFPHLDIINDLLDEDPNLGMALKILQNPSSSGFNRPLSLSGHNPLHKVNYSQLTSDRSNGVGIDGMDRSRGGDSTDERPSSNGLRDSVRMNGPFQHLSLARLHNQHGVLDGVSSHFWPIGSSAMPTGNVSNGRNGLDQHIAYSLVQGHHHLNVPDCSGFTLGHNGYTVYAPQQP
ncbi:hypothetical protein R1sor_021662 [Riccia sorocarpa]|uniref:MATH domain-containing protein n=1 Tax=Riccia sorocarpa TaxID=122646 RepID=A0ABD3GJC9_9MARC